MAGFLSSIAGGVLGGLGVTGLDAAKTLQNYQTVKQQQSNREAFGAALEKMGPEGEIFRQMYAAGASIPAINATMEGGVGQDIRQQYIQGQIDNIVKTTPDPMERAWKIYAVTQDAGLLKSLLEAQRFQQEHPGAASYKKSLQDFLDSKPANLDNATKNQIMKAIASDDPAEPELVYKAIESKYFGGMFLPKLAYVESIGTTPEGLPVNIRTPMQYTGAAGGPKAAVPAGPPETSFPPAPYSPAEEPSPDETAIPSPTARATAGLPSFVPPTPTGLPSAAMTPEGIETETPGEVMSPTAAATAAPGALTPGVPYTLGAPINPAVGTATPTPTPTPTAEPVMGIPPAEATIAPTPTPAPGLRPSVKAGAGYAKMAAADRMVAATGGAARAVRAAAAQLPGGLTNPMGGTQWDNYTQVKLGIPVDPRIAQFMALVSTLKRVATQATVMVTGSSAMRAAIRMQGIHIPQEHDSPRLVLQKLDTFQQPGGIYDLFRVEAGSLTEADYMQRLLTGPLGPTDWKPTAGGFEYSPSLWTYRRR